MKKKITAVLLMIIMTVSLFGATVHGEMPVADERVQTFITRLASQSSSDRKSITNAVAPLLMTNTGLDALTHYINAYDPDSNSMFNVVVGKVLSFTDKEMALKFLDILRAIDAGIREDYLTGFMNRTERGLSPFAQSSLESFIKRQCSLYDGLEKILSEDGITTGVIARLFEIPYKMNNSRPILTDNGSGFDIYEVDPMLSAVITNADLLDQDSSITSADEVLNAVVEWLNSGFLMESKVTLKTILADVGVYIPTVSNVSGLGGAAGGAAGGVATTPVPTTETQTRVGYEQIESSIELGYDIIEICSYTNGVKDAYGKFAVPQVVKIKVTAPNVMIYKIEADKLTPVKYSAYIGGELVCKVSASGKYAVKIVDYYFNDVTGWGKDYIESLYNRGIISGKAEGKFAPDDNITREEFVKLVVEIADIAGEKATSDFVDVNAGEWYENYVAVAQKNGFINGIGDGRFGIGNNITRQDMSKILSDLLLKKELVADISESVYRFGDAFGIAQYAQKAVGVLAINGIISGDENGNFNPENNATRQEAAKLMYKMLELYIIK